MCAAGSTCTAGACTAPAETNCFDGLDNDGNGLIDCADPACLHKHCTSGATSASVCCGTGPNATFCKNLGTDSANCGACGTACTSGACAPANSGSFYSGQCTCPGGGSQCPSGPGNVQTCTTGACNCGDDNDRCQSGAVCATIVCHY